MTDSASSVRFTGFYDAREVLRSREMRQALYDEGKGLMRDVIVTLHGDEHRARRRLENRLFRRDTFAYYEREVLPQFTAQALAPALENGSGDLISMSRHVMMNLAITIAGIDLQSGTEAEFEELYALMNRLSRASTVVHYIGDKEAIKADGDVALAEFKARWYEPSVRRRREILGRLAQGEIGEDDVPRDVLTTLLRNVDNLDLADDVVLREAAYFPWVGAHATSHAFSHAMHHVLVWCADHPEDAVTLRTDDTLLQRFVHEALRLHPSSPEAERVALGEVTLPSGQTVAEGTHVIVDAVRANRDPEVFGADAEEFNPYRTVPADVQLWGLTFGSGFHACLGQELAGGVPHDGTGPSAGVLHGAITVMGRILLQAGAHLDPDRPPQPDAASKRPNFSSFPVAFSAPVGATH